METPDINILSEPDKPKRLFATDGYRIPNTLLTGLSRIYQTIKYVMIKI